MPDNQNCCQSEPEFTPRQIERILEAMAEQERRIDPAIMPILEWSYCEMCFSDVTRTNAIGSVAGDSTFLLNVELLFDFDDSSEELTVSRIIYTVPKTEFSFFLTPVSEDNYLFIQKDGRPLSLTREEAFTCDKLIRKLGRIDPIYWQMAGHHCDWPVGAIMAARIYDFRSWFFNEIACIENAPSQDPRLKRQGKKGRRFTWRSGYMGSRIILDVTKTFKVISDKETPIWYGELAIPVDPRKGYVWYYTFKIQGDQVTRISESLSLLRKEGVQVCFYPAAGHFGVCGEEWNYLISPVRGTPLDCREPLRRNLQQELSGEQDQVDRSASHKVLEACRVLRLIKFFERVKVGNPPLSEDAIFEIVEDSIQAFSQF